MVEIILTALELLGAAMVIYLTIYAAAAVEDHVLRIINDAFNGGR